MNPVFEEILKNSIDSEVSEEIIKNYYEVKDLNVFELGIDSLDYMSLLVTLEEELNVNLDSFEDINSLSDMERLIIK